MKKTTSFLLLLLVFLCTDQAQAETEKETHPCLQDIHAALREMTTSLTRLKIEMTILQKDNQAQAAKLDGQKAEIEKQKTETEKLKKHLQVQQVAFSAGLYPDNVDIFLGPFPTHTPLVFRHVVTNIGNAYNPNSGVFTAPVRGAYQFDWHINLVNSPNPTGVELIKNGEHIFLAWEQEPNGFGSSSQSVNLILEVGDVVLLRLWPGTRIFDNVNRHTTFSGRLLFPM